jgi:hypothetical protein
MSILAQHLTTLNELDTWRLVSLSYPGLAHERPEPERSTVGGCRKARLPAAKVHVGIKLFGEQYV